MSKKTITFLITVLFLIGLGFVIYFFFFNNNEDTLRRERPDTDIINPFGDFLPTDNIDRSGDVNTNNIFDREVPKLRQITSVPVAGSTIFNRTIDNSTSTETIIQYVERATGHIYETKTTELDNERITNTTIPKVYDALFLNNKEKVVYRYLDDNENIKTYLATLNIIPVSTTTASSSEEYEGEIDTEIKLTGSFLSDNIKNFSVSPTNYFFSLFKLEDPTNTRSVGYVFTDNNITEPELVLNTELSQIQTEWINDDYISITTNASYLAEGYSYILNTNTGNTDKIIGSELGLTTKYSQDLEKVLYSFISNGVLSSRILNIDSNEVTNPGFRTISEKCIWGEESVIIFCGTPSQTSGDFPDAWYLGNYSFNDSIISYNTVTEEGRVHYINGETRGIQLDVIKPQLSPNEDFLLFQNKKDLSLWSLDLN